MKAVLGYWKIRGLGQAIRLLLNYVGEEYEEVLYETGGPPDYNRDVWCSVKPNLGLDFPNLPYYIDGDIKLTQSNAILRYIARKHNLCGTTDAERAAVDMVDHETRDFWFWYMLFAYSEDFNKKKESFMVSAKTRIDNYEKYLGEKTFFVGEEITFVDFTMYEFLDQHFHLDPSLLDGCQKIKAFLKRFEDLPRVKAFMTSEKFVQYPINNKVAFVDNAL